VGGRVGVEVSPLNSRGPFLTAIGHLRAIHDLGGHGRRALSFEVDDATFRISAQAFASASLEEYGDDAGRIRWRLLAVELRFGVVIEVEEIPIGWDGAEWPDFGWGCAGLD